ncbi:hypothetical protein EMN47_15315 [Prolixibacteraceae bacterium JC049]|nr:hypothetical protein [Prolixibacteraceae bacterium JC049]
MYINLTNQRSKRAISLLSLLLLAFILLPNALHAAKGGKNSEDIKRGKRFFMGLLPKELNHESCVSCHALTPIDTLSWNPSALEIAKVVDAKTFDEFKSSLMAPVGKKMTEVHKNFEIEEADLKRIRLYLKDLNKNGLPPAKKTYYNLILFLFLGVIITLGLVDLIFTRKIKYPFVTLLVIGLALAYQLKMVSEEAIALGRSEGYAPDQPIKFSHKIHAGENNIDCKYCHNTVEQSKSAGIPSVNLCLNCHSLVREGANSGQFEINKIHTAVMNKESVEWIRIHKLPDHVFFSHAQHVGVAGLDCNKCHGDVENMHVLKQQEDLSMGWCVNCHRETNVNMEDNEYYESFKKQHDLIKQGKQKAFTADQLGSNDCMKCHY